MPAPLHLLGAKPYPCGCGRTWGCVELYTTLAGLPYLLAERLAQPSRPPARFVHDAPKEKALALRGLAQKGDPLAIELFHFQARAMGLPRREPGAGAGSGSSSCICGGLMDPENTTDEFRARYLDLVRETARPHLWPVQRERLTVVPSTLGELSQAIGAALVALDRSRRLASRPWPVRRRKTTRRC